MVDKKVLPEARGLVKEFALEGGKKGKSVACAVSGVNPKIYEEEMSVLMGEPGCGGDILGRTLIRLLDTASGIIEPDGMDTMGMKDKEFVGIRRQMQIIFQDPCTFLSPKMNAKEVISEPLATYGLAKNRVRVKSQVQALMDGVEVLREFINRYPYQFSGGQRQRIGIARAVTLHPRLIICDKPVSALDVSTQSQILSLLKDPQKQYQLTYLSISHDPRVVKFISDRVCVMFLGMVRKVRDTHELYSRPLHPCTRFLFNAIPKVDPRLRSDEQELLTGEILGPVSPLSGCRFHIRRPYTKGVYNQKAPEGTMAGERQTLCYFSLI